MVIGLVFNSVYRSVWNCSTNLQLMHGFDASGFALIKLSKSLSTCLHFPFPLSKLDQ